jgi:hypothetical protein
MKDNLINPREYRDFVTSLKARIIVKEQQALLNDFPASRHLFPSAIPEIHRRLFG